MMNRIIGSLLVLSVIGLGLAEIVSAAEFRSRIAIRTPAPPVDGGIRVERLQQVDRRIIEEIVHKLYASYGFDSQATGDLLDASFPDRSRLLNTMAQRVPRDARLKVLGIQSVRTLDQFLNTDTATGKTSRVSTVTATVRGQLEFDDGTVGFQRLEGTVEYLFRVVQEMGRR